MAGSRGWGDKINKRLGRGPGRHVTCFQGLQNGGETKFMNIGLIVPHYYYIDMYPLGKKL